LREERESSGTRRRTIVEAIVDTDDDGRVVLGFYYSGRQREIKRLNDHDGRKPLSTILVAVLGLRLLNR
jgi:hypothetical protein